MKEERMVKSLKKLLSYAKNSVIKHHVLILECLAALVPIALANAKTRKDQAAASAATPQQEE
jgi:hypothetical protein